MTDFSLEIVRDETSFLKLQDSWQTLENACSGAVLFQSFAWCRIAVATVLKNQPDDMFVCCVYADDDLVGLLPLRLLKKRFYTVLTGFAEPFQEFTDMLVKPGISPTVVFETIQPALADCGADFLHFGQVRTDSLLFEAIQNRIRAVGEQDAAPYVPLNQSENFEVYLKTIKSKTRKNMRNQRNVLERTYPVVHDVVEGGEALDQIIERTYANRAQWLVEKGLTSAAFSDVQFQGFLNQFKANAVSGINTLGMSLKHGSTVMAEQWGFIHHGRYYAFISSYDVEYARLSPGKLHLGEVIKTGFEKRLSTMEFMLPDVPYKRTWAPDAVSVQDHILGFTTKGRVYARLWVDIMRPLVKRGAMLLPENVRRGMLALVFWR